MKKYVPVSKKTKRAQKEYYSAKRQTWNGLNPATRTMHDSSVYNRSKSKHEARTEAFIQNDNASVF